MNEINPALIGHIPADSHLRNLLQTEKLPQYDFIKMTAEVKEFTKRHLSKLKNDEIKVINDFYGKGIYNPNIIDAGLFNEQIAKYPAVLWTLRQIKKRKKE
jgi:hypothetical protein